MAEIDDDERRGNIFAYVQSKLDERNPSEHDLYGRLDRVLKVLNVPQNRGNVVREVNRGDDHTLIKAISYPRKLQMQLLILFSLRSVKQNNCLLQLT